MREWEIGAVENIHGALPYIRFAPILALVGVGVNRIGKEITSMEVLKIDNNIITIQTDYQWEWEGGSQGASYQFLWQGGSQRHAGSDVGIATFEKYGSTYKVLKFETDGMTYYP